MRGVFEMLSRGRGHRHRADECGPTARGIQDLPPADDELMVLCGPGHRFAARSCVSLEEVLIEPKALFKAAWEEYAAACVCWATPCGKRVRRALSEPHTWSAFCRTIRRSPL